MVLRRQWESVGGQVAAVARWRAAGSWVDNSAPPVIKQTGGESTARGGPRFITAGRTSY